MPNRILREGILSSERVVALSGPAELFYRKLYSVVDDYGRYYAAPGTLRGACWPTAPEKVTEAEIESWLSECQQGDEPLLTIYVVKGAKYMQINDFGQQIRSKSKFPDPDINCVQIASTSRSRISETESNTKSKTEAVSPTAVKPKLVREMEPFKPADGDLIAERIIEACMDRHPIPGSVDLARTEIMKKIRDAPDPGELADRIIAAHAKFCEYWKIHPPGPKRLLAWWIRDGDYLHPPQAVPQAVLSKTEQALKALWPQGRPAT